ncbi:transporter substrate-binding domain-containing protein [uncultured Cedecea sp.]|uniref:ATP-binding protein n=1 Tax=uncultured Cedecea sp. TaxID=988762 RepID=UPI00262FB5F0|nr:transporter substrate-binding domain-containing protein [uncultured Cedecea sp.]
MMAFSRVQASMPDELELTSQRQVFPVAISLSEEDKHWLNNHKALRVGIYPQTHSPVVQNIFTDRYRGINADYLAIIQSSLGTHIKVIRLDNKQQAIEALKEDKLDAVLTGLEYLPGTDQSLIASMAVTRSWPNLVTSISNTMSPVASQENVRVSAYGNYPDDQFIYQSFPNADIIRYSNYEEALKKLSTGEDNYFIGDSLTTSIWLSQEFQNTIVTLKYWSEPQKNSVFLFRTEQSELQRIFNNVLSHIDENMHGQIAYSTIDKGDLSFLIDPLAYTPHEQQWLSQNKKIKVIVNPWYMPYTLIDSEQDIRGITGDVLNLINLQTGLTFEPIMVRSYDEMISEINKGGWHMVVPAIYDTKKNHSLLYTQPFINTQFVSVVRKDNFSSAELRPGMSVALSDEHPLLTTLQRQYTDIKWRPVKNVNTALNLLASGKVDAAIANRLTVRYFSEHYYHDRLLWQPLPNTMPAAFTFSVSPHEPELKSILDKAWDNVPQREMFQIVSKWLRLPNVKTETWELYNKPFYIVTVLATLLVLSCVIWIIYLTLAVRKRKRLQRLLEQEKNKVQQAGKEKQEFLSRMSHELRTPVSAIVGYLELLQHASAYFKNEDKVSIDQAAKASHLLLKLIGEILDIEKVESGMIEVSPEWGKIDTLIMSKIVLFQDIANKKGISIDYTSCVASDQVMLLDFQRLGQVLNNVIDNAVKFTQQGSINISVSLENQKNLIIIVTDTGPGIAQHVQSRLFEAFIQAGHQSTEQGSGLGLTISKVLMSKMRGTIFLQSEEGKGTTLTIVLPVETKNDVIVESPVITPVPVSVDPNLRVLIADDLPAGRLLLQRQLSTLGIKSDEAADGQEALSLLQQAHYDILITDVNMPVMDGVTLAKTVREHNSNIIICGLTATAQIHERERCLAAGMNFCLFKPINISQLALLLFDIKPEVSSFFDMKRLTVLAQGNRLLMLNALKDAQQENRNDFSKAHVALMHSDYQAMKYHIHRIRGTALLLGSTALADQTQLLEDKLMQADSDDGLLAMLEHTQDLLDELDIAIQDFTP